MPKWNIANSFSDMAENKKVDPTRLYPGLFEDFLKRFIASNNKYEALHLTQLYIDYIYYVLGKPRQPFLCFRFLYGKHVVHFLQAPI